MFGWDGLKNLPGEASDECRPLVSRIFLISRQGVLDPFDHVTGTDITERPQELDLRDSAVAVGSLVDLKGVPNGTIELPTFAEMRIHPCLGVPKPVFAPAHDRLYVLGNCCGQLHEHLLDPVQLRNCFVCSFWSSER
jgi:hypothetical protein